MLLRPKAPAACVVGFPPPHLASGASCIIFGQERQHRWLRSASLGWQENVKCPCQFTWHRAAAAARSVFTFSCLFHVLSFSAAAAVVCGAVAYSVVWHASMCRPGVRGGSVDPPACCSWCVFRVSVVRPLCRAPVQHPSRRFSAVCRIVYSLPFAVSACAVLLCSLDRSPPSV